MSDDEEPKPELTIEERMAVLERTMEVLRAELISQNKRLRRCEEIFPAKPRRMADL